MHPTLWDFTRSPCAQPQARPTLQISFPTVLHRRIIWSSSQLSVRRRPSLHSSPFSDRNHTPLSGDFSQVCNLENVSRRCNHQHSLSTREPFSTRPSLSQKILELFLGKWFGEDICDLFMSRKILHVYFFLCTMSLI
jgi:hypothetical protein